MVAIAVLLFALVAATAHAQTFPKLTGRVVDDANLLDAAQEISLTQKLETLETQSGRQLVVTTVADLQGYDIADYGYQLGRTWGIGQAESGDAEKDNGVLLIVAPTERKVRIEVGYGLEGILTDALSTVIIQNDILPRFRDNDYPGGIDAGVNAISTQLTLPPEEARAKAAATAEKAKKSESSGIPFGLLFWLVIIGVFILPNFFLRGAKGRAYREGLGEVILWGAAMAINSRGGDGGGSSWGGGDGGFSGGGGSFGGGGASGDW